MFSTYNVDIIVTERRAWSCYHLGQLSLLAKRHTAWMTFLMRDHPLQGLWPKDGDQDGKSLSPWTLMYLLVCDD